jgi:hypothetical protein
VSTDYNPVAIEHAIRECANRIAKGVTVCSERYQAYQKAEREFVQAYAQARLAAPGAQLEKRYYADAETMELRERRDVAKAAYKHAEAQAQALREELRALQSVNKSVMGMYGVAGRGEGA